ncbi:MAG: DUF4337 domain-containing protein [Rhodomicrobium sp.]
MKKNSQRKPKPRVQPRPAASPAALEGAERPEHEREERKVGIVSGTPADTFDETSERKHDKWVAIYISVLAVLIAISLTGSNDAMKIAQQAGIQVNDNYAFYQAKTIRKQQIQIASDQLELKTLESPNLAEPARKFLDAKKIEYDKENDRLEFNPKKGNGRKELLAKAESCDNLRNIALAQHPFYDYSGAMLQIAIVLASASIITGARLLLGVSGGVGLFGILLFLNGYALVYGSPSQNYDKLEALRKALPLMHHYEAIKIARCPIE